MTKEEALAELKDCQNLDPETGHSWADSVLIKFLRAQGHNDIADAWEAIKPKWYA